MGSEKEEGSINYKKVALGAAAIVATPAILLAAERDANAENVNLPPTERPIAEIFQSSHFLDYSINGQIIVPVYRQDLESTLTSENSHEHLITTLAIDSPNGEIEIPVNQEKNENQELAQPASEPSESPAPTPPLIPPETSTPNPNPEPTATPIPGPNPSPAPESTPEPESEYATGDVDCNGVINAVDAMKILQENAGLREGEYGCVVDGINLILADVDSDDDVDSIDALHVLRHAGGLIEDFDDLDNESNPHGHDIEINGNENSVILIVEALDLMQEELPEFYEEFINNVGIIEFVTEGSGIYAGESPPRIVIGVPTLTSGKTWLVGTFRHELEHWNMWKEAFDASEDGSVPSEAWKGNEEVEMRAMAAQMEILIAIGAPQSEIDHLQNVIDDPQEFWKTPIDK